MSRLARARLALVLLVSTALSGCAGVGGVVAAAGGLEGLAIAVGSAATVGRATYCNLVAEEGRIRVRDVLTDGVRFVDCPPDRLGEGAP